MRTVHIGIRHDDNLVIAKLCDIKVIAIAFRESAAEGIYHGLDLGVGQNLINRSLLHIQNLAANGHDGLIHTVSRHLGRASGRISLHYEDLTFLGISRLAVCKLTV